MCLARVAAPAVLSLSGLVVSLHHANHGAVVLHDQIGPLTRIKPSLGEELLPWSPGIAGKSQH